MLTNSSYRSVCVPCMLANGSLLLAAPLHRICYLIVNRR